MILKYTAELRRCCKIIPMYIEIEYLYKLNYNKSLILLEPEL